MDRDDSRPGYYDHLVFNAPLSRARADRLATDIAVIKPATVLDLGCGWGELLITAMEHAEEAHGTGVDSDPALLARARRMANARGVAERVTFIEGDAGQYAGPANVVICVGSDHALGGGEEALNTLRQLVRPGGLLLFGKEYRVRTPSAAESAAAGEVIDELIDLADLVALAASAGFRPLRIESGSRDELDAFESGYLADLEWWLMEHSTHPDASDVRANADRHREAWLRGYREVFGFAYLTLGVPRY